MNLSWIDDNSLSRTISDSNRSRSLAIDSGLNDLGVVHPFPFLPFRCILIISVFP